LPVVRYGFYRRVCIVRVYRYALYVAVTACGRLRLRSRVYCRSIQFRCDLHAVAGLPTCGLCRCLLDCRSDLPSRLPRCVTLRSGTLPFLPTDFARLRLPLPFGTLRCGCCCRCRYRLRSLRFACSQVPFTIYTPPVAFHRSLFTLGVTVTRTLRVLVLIFVTHTRLRYVVTIVAVTITVPLRDFVATILFYASLPLFWLVVLCLNLRCVALPFTRSLLPVAITWVRMFVAFGCRLRSRILRVTAIYVAIYQFWVRCYARLRFYTRFTTLRCITLPLPPHRFSLHRFTFVDACDDRFCLPALYAAFCVHRLPLFALPFTRCSLPAFIFVTFVTPVCVTGRCCVVHVGYMRSLHTVTGATVSQSVEIVARCDDLFTHCVGVAVHVYVVAIPDVVYVYAPHAVACRYRIRCVTRFYISLFPHTRCAHCDLLSATACRLLRCRTRLLPRCVALPAFTRLRCVPFALPVAALRCTCATTGSAGSRFYGLPVYSTFALLCVTFALVNSYGLPLPIIVAFWVRYSVTAFTFAFTTHIRLRSLYYVLRLIGCTVYLVTLPHRVYRWVCVCYRWSLPAIFSFTFTVRHCRCSVVTAATRHATVYLFVDYHTHTVAVSRLPLPLIYVALRCVARCDRSVLVGTDSFALRTPLPRYTFGWNRLRCSRCMPHYVALPFVPRFYPTRCVPRCVTHLRCATLRTVCGAVACLCIFCTLPSPRCHPVC